MKYISVCKALYAYEAQTEEEMSFPEDAVLYLIEKEDTEWWKAQLKMPDPGETGPVGLVPANYLAEVRVGGFLPVLRGGIRMKCGWRKGKGKRRLTFKTRNIYW